MIEELYIIDENKNVLYGSPGRVSPSLESPTELIEGDYLFTAIRCNKVHLGALYKGFHPLHVVQFLRLVAKHLPPELDSKRVKSKYFLIFDVLSKCCVGDVFLTDQESTQILPVNIFSRSSVLTLNARNEIFFNVTEHVSAILDEDSNVIKSEVVGKISCKTNFEKPTNIKVNIKYQQRNKVRFLSLNRKRGNHINTAFETIAYNFSFILTSYVTLSTNPPVFIKRTKEGYELFLDRKLSRVRTLIPVPKTAYAVNINVEKGIAKYVEEKDMIEWTIHEAEFLSTVIELGIRTLEEERVISPIKISFSGLGNISGLDISSTKVDAFKAISYVRYKVNSGSYEIRVN